MKTLDRNFIRDKALCPCCSGHIHIDTALSNAFGLGLNADMGTRNPYQYNTQHKLYVNFRLGQDAQSRETMEDAFKRLVI